jgi:uncharacterized protein (DUF1501 family)
MTTRASRRHFLKACSLMSIAGAASPFALNLAAISAASASTSPGYKALVCLFFYGGNDHTNTFIPFDQPSYDQYLAARDTIAIPRAQLATTGTVASQGGREFAFHPSLTASALALPTFADHWSANRLAVVANVGPLMVPTTRTQYQNRTVPLPPNLFSHNDQQSVWQAQQPKGEGAKVGWGGRIGDLLAGQNGNALFTCISAGGNSVFLSGQNVLQYQVGSNGATAISSISGTIYGSTGTTASTNYRTLITGASPNLFENELGVITNRSITAGQTLSTALQSAPTLNPTVPQNNGLASQLAIVARIISVADQLQTSRQVFLVSIGGFDNHDTLLAQHAQQLTQVNNAVGAFWSWLVQLGVQNQVTLFTASDFGRTLTSNGDGSDHGWGSHHFVLGGAVTGKDVYGTFQPTTFFASGNPVDIGQGNMVPQLSVDQYAATFARWLGVSDTDMPLVLPDIVNFSPRYIPFLP